MALSGKLLLYLHAYDHKCNVSCGLKRPPQRWRFHVLGREAEVYNVRALPLWTLDVCCLAADNVGDNVGDIAGMGADLFGSFAEATCAALVISSVSSLGQEHFYSSMSYPLLISGAGIVICLLTTFIATDLRPARMVSEIENTLKYQLIISTLLATPVRLPLP